MSSETEPAPVLVIGLGNAARHDDGAGLRLARFLEAEALPGVVVKVLGEPLALLDWWQDAVQVVVLDAVSSGSPAGTLHCFRADKEPLPAQFFRFSSHDFGLAEVIELARALGQLPESLTVYGLEGADFELGEGLSLELKQAMSTLLQQVKDDIYSPGHSC